MYGHPWAIPKTINAKMGARNIPLCILGEMESMKTICRSRRFPNGEASK